MLLCLNVFTSQPTKQKKNNESALIIKINNVLFVISFVTINTNMLNCFRQLFIVSLSFETNGYFKLISITITK